MSLILSLQCSPRQNGVTDSLADSFCRGASLSGANVIKIPLRNKNFHACAGCGNCRAFPHACIYDSDEAAEIFSQILSASLPVFFSPIYFYSLPAHFKALIDRSQKYWEMDKSRPAVEEAEDKPALIILTAGRKNGRELFSGAERTLRWFLKSLHFRPLEIFSFRGLENPADISLETEKLMVAAGQSWGLRLEAYANAGGRNS